MLIIISILFFLGLGGTHCEFAVSTVDPVNTVSTTPFPSTTGTVPEVSETLPVVSTELPCVPTNSCLGHYICTPGVECLVGWGGSSCTQRTEPFLPAVECPGGVFCLSGGTCFGGQCCCPPGYNGTLCQTDVLECASGPCRNSAVCVDMVNGYRCVCSDGQ